MCSSPWVPALQGHVQAREGKRPVWCPGAPGPSPTCAVGSTPRLLGSSLPEHQLQVVPGSNCRKSRCPCVPVSVCLNPRSSGPLPQVARSCQGRGCPLPPPGPRCLPRGPAPWKELLFSPCIHVLNTFYGFFFYFNFNLNFFIFIF